MSRTKNNFRSQFHANLKADIFHIILSIFIEKLQGDWKKKKKRFKMVESFLWTNCYWQHITSINPSGTICIWNGPYTRPIKNDKERQRIKETGGQKWKARRWKERQANREELEGRSTWGSSKQESGQKTQWEKKKLTVWVSWWCWSGAKPCGPHLSHIFISCSASLSPVQPLALQ